MCRSRHIVRTTSKLAERTRKQADVDIGCDSRSRDQPVPPGFVASDLMRPGGTVIPSMATGAPGRRNRLFVACNIDFGPGNAVDHWHQTDAGNADSKTKMIKAKVETIIPGANGGDAKAFARSRALISQDNPNGEVMFYVAPPFWTDGRSPRKGQQVLIGQVERKTSAHWRHPRWLARDVSPAFAIQHYSSSRILEPTQVALGAANQSWFGRLLAIIGLRPAAAIGKA
jgi:hypothetical protein